MGLWSSLFGRRPKSLPIKRVAAPPSQPEYLPIDRPDDIFASFHREIDRVFGALANGVSEVAPWITVDDSGPTLEIRAQMPGLQEKDVEVSVSDDVLTIRGSRQQDKTTKLTKGRMRQQSFAAFKRSLRLPPGTEPRKMRASFAKGELRISVPKAKAAPPQRLEARGSRRAR